MYEFTGKVKAVGEVQTFASGFTKRELVVEEWGLPLTGGSGQIRRPGRCGTSPT